jgi:hypothetical protein
MYVESQKRQDTPMIVRHWSKAKPLEDCGRMPLDRALRDDETISG